MNMYNFKGKNRIQETLGFQNLVLVFKETVVVVESL